MNEMDSGEGTKTKEEDTDENSTIQKCGSLLFNYYPDCLQRFATAKVYLACLSFVSIFEGMMFAYVMGTLTSVERHFQMSSQETGMLLTVAEVVPVVTTMFVSFYGGRGNRPRWQAGGIFIVVIYCTVMFLGYLVVPIPNFSTTIVVEAENSSQSTTNSTSEVLCYLPDMTESNYSQFGNNSRPQKECTIHHGGSQTLAFFILFVAFAMLDLGPSTLYTIGIPYMDDGVSKKDMPMYLSIVITVRCIGPLLGQMLSSICLRIYIYPNVDPGIKDNDPKWIGAWWLGFLIMANIFIICGILLTLFPRKLKKPNVIQSKEEELKDCTANKTSCTNGDIPDPDNKKDETSAKKNICDTFQLKELWNTVVRLLKNPVLMCCCATSIFNTIGAIGFEIWMPKLMENRFHISKADASLHSGLGTSITIIVGIMVGGFLMRRYRPSARKLIGILAFTSFIYAAGVVGLMFITCDTSHQMPGTLLPDGSLELFDPRCTKECECGTDIFAPVCLEGPTLASSKTFFSACHAGCQVSLKENDTSRIYAYANCTCLDEPDTILMNESCGETCSQQLLIYEITLALLNFILGVTIISNIIIDIRCVSSEDKTVGLGFLTAAASAFGALPTPALFGLLVDSSCLIWEESCGQTGSCWVYNGSDFSTKFHLTGATFFALAGVFEVIKYKYAGGVNLNDDDDDPKTSSDISLKQQKSSESQL